MSVPDRAATIREHDQRIEDRWRQAGIMGGPYEYERCVEDWARDFKLSEYLRAQQKALIAELLAAAKDAAREWRLHGQLTDSCRPLEAAIARAEGTS